MSEHKFRFGVVVTPQGGGEQWAATAKRVEELGYSTLLMPDGLQLLSPFSSLAVAACATTTLRVGTFVLASPLRPPRAAAWEGHSLSLLTEGRFDFGIGTGRPEAQRFAEALGRPWGSAGERLREVSESIEHLRELDGDRHTPVLVAAGGPKALALAARTADIVTLAAPPLSGRDHHAGMVAQLRDAAGERDIQIAMNLFVVGDEIPPWTQHFIGADHATLVAHDSQTLLRGTPAEMADELQRRRDAYGVSYVSVNGSFLEQFAPVVERLAGS
ncbi:putative F420-dependent oxidoreductase [Pseudonocardia hierapolitana]|uniref:Putative F420-dependent oxidoreductase n=1 Tax=Pseudonocardia hierapolitana TaxID=1128676 RepID=A0A561SM02_9PSEU|nr:LLM class flavin-dependent oxidoreductase [Pseudonocardia hierapolitana]TWF75881.1 putative F420-dependent oxidoreductase [Pseudonocardia hierapolitana]